MNNNEKLALQLASAIEKLAKSPEHLDNFVSYLTAHFPDWIEKFANTPEGLVNEFAEFANMEF